MRRKGEGGPIPRGRTSPSSAAAKVLLSVACALLAFAAYANSLDGGFVWDDPVVLNRQLTVFQGLGDVLFPPPGIPQFSPDYYRPLTIASLLLDRAVGQGRPFPFHLSVVLFHAFTSALVCAVGLRLLGSDRRGRFGAFACGALFAAHPIHTESVAWVAGRSDVLATGFLLSAFLLHISSDSLAARSLTGLLAFLALCSKETAVTVVPLLALHDWMLRRPVVRLDWIPRHAAPLVAVLAYLVLRHLALPAAGGSRAGAGGLGWSAWDVLGALGVYLPGLVWPVRQSAYIDAVPVDALSLAASVAALFGLTAAGVRCWRSGRREVAFSLAWVLVTLLPSLAIVWTIPEAPVAERYLYLPSAGFCLLFGALVSGATLRSPARRLAWAGFATVAVATAFTTTVRRNRVWHDNLSLWTATAATATVSGMPLRSLGAAYLDAGREEDARRSFEQALRRRNSTIGLQVIHSNLGTIAMRANDFEAARRHYREALDLNENAADVLFNLGLATFMAGRGSPAAAAEALTFYRRAEALSPHDPDIHAALGQALATTGDQPAAERHLRRALELGLAPASVERVKAYLDDLGRRSP